MRKIPIDMGNDSCKIDRKSHDYIQRCNHATVRCKGPPGVGPVTCGGVVRYRDMDFLYRGVSLFRDSNGTQAVCREVRARCKFGRRVLAALF